MPANLRATLGSIHRGNVGVGEEMVGFRRLIAICLLGYGIWFCFQVSEWTWGFIVYVVAWFGIAIYFLVFPAGAFGGIFPGGGSDGNNGGNGNGGGNGG